MIILQLWNFTCCFSHDLSTDLSKTLLFFYAKPHFLCEFYAPLSSFFYFFILFKFPIWTTIPIIKKTTKKIYFLIYSHSKNKRPVEKNLTFGIIMKHIV